MTSYWQQEREALDRLGFAGIDGSQDRKRAVVVVAELLQELRAVRGTHVRPHVRELAANVRRNTKALRSAVLAGTVATSTLLDWADHIESIAQQIERD